VPTPTLSIIIPAYNEAGRLIPTLEQAETFVKAQSYPIEVIVVDDGSKDDTYATALNFVSGRENFKLIKNPSNLGKGAAIKKGMEAASGALRLFSDADLSTPLEEIHKFISYLEPKDVRPGDNRSGDSQPAGNYPADYQIVIGSRRVKGARVAKRQPFYREGAGRVFSFLVRIFLLGGFLDTQCGFKMFTAEAARNIFPRLTINRFGFDIEILFVAQKIFGYKIKEAPVTWYDSPSSKVRLAKDSLQMFLDIFRIRWRWLKGKYRP